LDFSANPNSSKNIVYVGAKSPLLLGECLFKLSAFLNNSSISSGVVEVEPWK